MHRRDTEIMDREGCTCCVFDPYVFIQNPKTGEVVDTFLTNVCLTGATLRLTAGLLASKVDDAETIGERDERLENFFKARQEYFDHVRYGS
jgi:hypothetical protein